VERSKDGVQPYYPVPNEKNQELYRRYQKMASKEKNVTFVGHLANYKYFNMDEAILNALELFDKDTGIPETEQWTDLLAPEKSEAEEK
jgi:UDP-galactopyranose mutase